MKNIKNKAILLLTAFVLLGFANGCSVATKGTGYLGEILCSVYNNTDNCANNLFLSSWKAISDEYYDTTYNKQDWSRWKKRYNSSNIKTMDDAYVAIDSMVESLNDPYTIFLRPDEFKSQNMSISAELFGIGVNIAKFKGDTLVLDVIENSPAKKEGLAGGDIITKINQTAIKGFPLKKVAEMVRGKAGTKVILTILRNKKYIVKNVSREKIELKSVEQKMIDKKIAYIKISNFISQDTSNEFEAALQKSTKAEGIIVDIRGNHGGLLPNAVFISNMFLKKGIIVSIVDKNKLKQDISAESTGFDTDKPLVVLINQGSASASEIFSGAMKDHKRAPLVGEKTYGKGLVQKINKLPSDAGINITIARYLTPNGTDINKKGIEPDYKVVMTQKDFLSNKDPQLDKAKQVLKQEMKNYVFANN